MSKVVAIDIETYDPFLSIMGNGSMRKDVSVLCVCTYDGHTEKTFSPGHGEEELERMLADPSITWVMHNAVYDADILQNGCGMRIAGKIEDTCTRESLLNEYLSHYSLDACCQRAGIEGKNAADTLELWWNQNGGKGNYIKNLPFIPLEIVVRYCQQDVRATFNLYMHQQPKLEAQGLLEANELEMSQIPVVLELRKNGIRIDTNKVERLRIKTLAEVAREMEMLKNEYGLTSITEKKGEGALPSVLLRMGLAGQLLRTPTGQISTSEESLLGCDHPIAEAVRNVKLKRSMLDKYLNSALVTFLVGDRIYGTFTPTKRDEGGTITGRYAASLPNLQQISSREAKGGHLLRDVFVPDEGCWMAKLDYSQIEYRLFAHYAVGPGAVQLRYNYCKGGVDYHQLVMDMLGWKGKDMRRVVKQFNFGCIYGLSLNGFKKKFKLEVQQAAAAKGLSTDRYTEIYYKMYYNRMTFVRPTIAAIEAHCKRNGGIKSVGGRMHHNPPDEAWYKMTNYLVQGSAADINKMGLRDAYLAGVFNTLKLHLTVHDEVVCSVPKTKEGLDAVAELQRCMCDCFKLRVPIEADPGLGKSWYYAGADSGKRVYELMVSRLRGRR